MSSCACSAVKKYLPGEKPTPPQLRSIPLCHCYHISMVPPPPLHKHQESEESDGQTGSRCLDNAVLARDTEYQKKACPENLPIPHPKHNSHNRALEHNV